MQRTRVHGRRGWIAVALVAVVVLGLTTHFVGSGPVADFAGDLLYAAMLYLLVAFFVPHLSTVVLGTVAVISCALIEVFQLTGLPALLASSFWPTGLILGTAFSPLDFVAYLAGAAGAAAADLAARRSAVASAS